MKYSRTFLKPFHPSDVFPQPIPPDFMIPKVFLYFQGVHKDTSDMKLVKHSVILPSQVWLNEFMC